MEIEAITFTPPKTKTAVDVFKEYLKKTHSDFCVHMTSDDGTPFALIFHRTTRRSFCNMPLLWRSGHEFVAEVDAKEFCEESADTLTLLTISFLTLEGKAKFQKLLNDFSILSGIKVKIKEGRLN